MNAFVKIGAVLAGYAVAVLAAGAALEIRLLNTQGPDAQASAGMYAFGDAMLFLVVFGFAALFPTGLAVYFLRPYRLFWTALSVTALAIAGTGALAAAVYILAACLALPRESPLLMWAALAVLRMLAAPLLAAAFVLAGVIAPNRSSRWSLIVAAGIEGAAATYAAVHWFAGCCFI
jgi:hypothetical protein